MFFVLKLSKLCNLRCTYCYEYDELGLSERMPIEGLDRFFAWLAERQPPRGWRPMEFVFHGGEPLLLPQSYLEAVVKSQEDHLGRAGIAYVNSLQTNLTRLDDRILAMLDRLRIGLGVSLDVFGEQRIYGSGRDSQGKVLENLQKVLDSGLAGRLGVGIISVMHRGNIDRVISVFEFCAELGLSYRVLPVFSLADPPARMTELTLDHDAVVGALQRLGKHWLEAGLPIDVFPLVNYLDAAVHSLLGRPAPTYDPAAGDWAYIVNTNGDAYSHAEAYSEAGWMGNIFRQPLVEILASPAHRRTLVPRLARAGVCTSCRFGSFCSRVPLVESLPSERAYESDGSLRCPIALPMIDFFREQLLADADSAALVYEARSKISAESAPA